MKDAREKRWENATPRGLKELLGHPQDLSEDSKVKLRIVITRYLDHYSARLELIRTMADSPMKKALTQSHQRKIQRLEEALAEF